jgi:hypothetical protein
MHIGYCISYNGESSSVFSVPITFTRSRVQSLIGLVSMPLGKADDLKHITAFV